MSQYLVGKTLLGIQIASDKKALRFVTSDGDVIAQTDGDCCSNSWVEHVNILTTFPAVVRSVENLDLPGSTDDGELQVYGCKIATDTGEIVIDYRNSSNGYYGGNLSWPDDEYFYGGVYGQNISTMEWTEIKED